LQILGSRASPKGDLAKAHASRKCCGCSGSDVAPVPRRQQLHPVRPGSIGSPSLIHPSPPRTASGCRDQPGRALFRAGLGTRTPGRPCPNILAKYWGQILGPNIGPIILANYPGQIAGRRDEAASVCGPQSVAACSLQLEGLVKAIWVAAKPAARSRANRPEPPPLARCVPRPERVAVAREASPSKPRIAKSHTWTAH
jgi:hypothetical protein